MPDETKTPSTTEDVPLPESLGVVTSEGAGAEEGGIKTEPTPTTKERVYSSVEWNKRQSEIDKAFAVKERTLKEEASRIAAEAEAERTKRAELEERLQKLEDDRLIASVEAEGGDVEATKKVLAKAAQVRQKELEVSRKEVEVNKRYASTLEATRLAAARDLATTYNLGDDVIASLLAETDPTKMENAALKLAIAGKKAPNKTTEQVIDGGTSVGNGSDFSKLSNAEQFEFLMRAKKYNTK